MKTKLILMTLTVAVASGSVTLADEKAHVITGQVVELDEGGITVQSGKKRVELTTPYATKYIGGRPKVGDTVRVNYMAEEYHARFSPDGNATKIEVIAAGGPKK